MTKFEQLKNYVARKGTFRFKDINNHFKQRPNSLNTYTTYLNTLRRAGFVRQVGRGEYEVLDAAALRKATSGEIMAEIKQDFLEHKIRELKLDVENAEFESNSLLTKNLDLESELRNRKERLSYYEEVARTSEKKLAAHVRSDEDQATERHNLRAQIIDLQTALRQEEAKARAFHADKMRIEGILQKNLLYRIQRFFGRIYEDLSGQE